MIKLEMKNYNVILIEKLPKYQSDHQAKLIDKYEYLTGEDILPSNQKIIIIIKQAKFTYSPLGKAFEKQIKIIEDQEEKQVKAIKDKKKQQLILMQILIKMNYCFQRKKKYLRIFIVKDLIE